MNSSFHRERVWDTLKHTKPNGPAGCALRFLTRMMVLSPPPVRASPVVLNYSAIAIISQTNNLPFIIFTSAFVGVISALHDYSQNGELKL